MLESVLRIAFIVTLLCGKSVTFAAKFITRHDPDDSIPTHEPVYHPINYRRVYNLRYEPTDRSQEITSNQHLNEMNEIPNDAISSQGVDDDQRQSSETTTISSAINDSFTDHFPEDTASSDISSSIMRPDGASSAKTTQIIGNGLKNLLYGSSSDATLLSGTSHTGKGFLSLFEVLKFENSKCSVSVSQIRLLHGICYHEFECRNMGGIAMGACANGVGVCCVFRYECGDATSQPLAYFESPNYPTPVRESLICVLIVNIRPNVKQIRLDFVMFELNRPTNGDCLQDQFIVSGQNMNFLVPVICGLNTGQHIYIDVDNAIENKLFLSIFGKGSSPRSFNIKITQLEKDLAPGGCLQYYTEPEGVVKSFNYDPIGTIVESGEGEATYFNNLNYAICIRRFKQMCSILYSNEGTTDEESGKQFDFQIINKDYDENDIVPDGQAGAGIFNCPSDYIAVNQLRLCGERLNDASEIDDFTLNAGVRDQSAGPIVLPFRTDGAYVGRGFYLMYKQEICV